MSDSVAVVIPAAGRGTRLGLDRTKALVEVAGKPILAWQLEMIPPHVEVVIVVGYQAHSVAPLVASLRPDAVLVVNHDFEKTGTAASLSLGARWVTADNLVALDGDLLVAPDDFMEFLRYPRPVLGVAATATKSPVHAQIVRGNVVALSQDEPSEWEWVGLTKLPVSQALDLGQAHVFHGLQHHLPMAAVEINSVEVDDMDDLSRMESWAKEVLAP